MESDNQLITIGITAYHEGQLLKKAWDSVVQQDDSRWNAVMVLDGDSDKETKQIFQNIEHASLKKIKLKNNGGNYKTRSFAIRNTNTKWYCHLDADDYLPENFVSIMNDMVKKYPETDIFYGDIIKIQNNMEFPISYQGIENKMIPFFINGHVPIKTSLFFEMHGYERSLFRGGADRDFLYRCAMKNKTFTYIDNHVIYNVRKRKGSTADFRKNNIEYSYKIFRHIDSKFNKYLNSINCYDRFFIKTIKPIFNFCISNKKIKMSITLLVKYGTRLNYFLWRHLLVLIASRIKLR